MCTIWFFVGVFSGWGIATLTAWQTHRLWKRGR